MQIAPATMLSYSQLYLHCRVGRLRKTRLNLSDFCCKDMTSLGILTSVVLPKVSRLLRVFMYAMSMWCCGPLLRQSTDGLYWYIDSLVVRNVLGIYRTVKVVSMVFMTARRLHYPKDIKDEGWCNNMNKLIVLWMMIWRFTRLFSHAWLMDLDRLSCQVV